MNDKIPSTRFFKEIESNCVSYHDYFTGPNGQMIEIREVWADNLEEEMENIRNVVENYPYISMVSY
jgi:hypothetical protein